MKVQSAAAVLSVAVVATAGAFGATTPIVGNVVTGKKLFKAHGCGTCHILSAAGYFDTVGTGPDLDRSRKTYVQDVAIITNGSIKKGMNPYKGALTTVEIEDLAALIYKSSHPD